MNLASSTRRQVFARLSIAVGNSVQVTGIVAAYFALQASRSAHSPAVAVATMILAWVLYFCSHAIAHWLVGRLVGIRFLFYTVGGTGNPEGWPRGVRWIFEHLPFFRRANKQGLDAKRYSRCQSFDVVCGCDRLGYRPDLRGTMRMALRCSREWMVSSVCFGLGLRNIGEQLDQ